MMYWYYVYTWRMGGAEHTVASVFNGPFSELILMAAEQPETWVVTFVKEISKEDYDLLKHELN